MLTAAANHRFWIDMSLECVRRDHTTGPGDQTGPFRSARALGMALAAPNAVYALAAGSVPLLALAPVPAMALLSAKQLEVAACATCAQVLKLRYPSQGAALDSAWLYWLQNVAGGQPGSTEETMGREVGAAIHQLGATDAKQAAGDMYSPSGLPYTHEAPPTQPKQGFAGADWGHATRLVTTRVANFPPPPGRVSATEFSSNSAHYQSDFKRVHDKGGINPGAGPNARTPAEEEIGIAWGYDGPPQLGTPPRLYMQAVLSVLDGLGAALSIKDALEIIAGVGLAMAEAGIDAWYYKYAPTHMMWRPAVGIRKAIAPNGAPDPGFLPLGRPDTNKRGLGLTPDFPAYPSGHATFGAAAFQLLRLYLVQKGLANFNANGVDNVALRFDSDEFNDVNTDPRTQKPRGIKTLGPMTLWQAIVDNSISRVYLGVHWQFDGLTKRNAANTGDEFTATPNALTPKTLGQTGGVWLGGQIAKQVAIKLGVTPATITASKFS